MVGRALGFVLVLLASGAHAQDFDETRARAWAGTLDALAISGGVVAMSAQGRADIARVGTGGAFAGALWGVSGPIVHRRFRRASGEGRIGWSLALRSVLPLAHGLVGHTAHLQYDLRKDLSGSPGGLRGMVAGMAVGAALASFFEQAWLLSDRPLTVAKRVGLAVMLSVIATIAVACFLPVWDAHSEAVEDR